MKRRILSLAAVGILVALVGLPAGAAIAAPASGVTAGPATAETASADAASLRDAGTTAELPPVQALPAGVDDFTFESMHADYTLSRDGAGHARLRTVETVVALFPDYDQNRGILRAIPMRDDERRIDWKVDVEGVTDENGTAVPWESEEQDGFLVLALGDDSYVHGRTTYVITYTERDVVTEHRDTNAQEFYWDVNGTGAAQPFAAVTATVELDDDLADALTDEAACYQGPQGSTRRCSIERDGTGWSASASTLAGHETMTIAIGFDLGTFTLPPSPLDSPMATVVPWIVLGLGVLALVAMIVVRARNWRDAPGRGIVIAEYEAPEGLGVLPAAAFASRESAGLPALLVQTAVSGATRLVDQPEEAATRRYRIDVVHPEAITNQDDWWAVTAVLGGAPTAGQSFVLDQGDVTIGDRIARLMPAARGRVSELGLRRRVASGRAGNLVRVLGLVVLVAAFGLLVWAGGAHVGTPLVIGGVVGGAALAILTLALSVPPVRRTREGSLLQEKLDGLKLYLTVAEEERLKVLQSVTGAERRRVDANDPAQVVRLYEELLPWAMLLGVEGSWAKVLADRYATTPPQSGDGLVAPGVLWNLSAFQATSATHQFATTPPVTSSSSWSSSGGGSSFGGGSSGGGFSGGGGGGGGFGGR